MRDKKLEHLILRLESHLECWKQFNHYVSQARTRQFKAEDETQFLEVKGIIAQELELIFAGVECSSPSKEEIHGLLGGAPSLRYMSELNEGTLRTLETQWHKIFISWQSLLGQLKVRQRQLEGQPFWKQLFGGSK